MEKHPLFADSFKFKYDSIDSRDLYRCQNCAREQAQNPQSLENPKIAEKVSSLHGESVALGTGM
jgi:hypothetical protein